MKRIDLDQPSAENSAGAESAISTSRVSGLGKSTPHHLTPMQSPLSNEPVDLGAILEQVLATVGALTANQQKILDTIRQRNEQRENTPASARPAQRPWGHTIKDAASDKKKSPNGSDEGDGSKRQAPRLKSPDGEIDLPSPHRRDLHQASVQVADSMSRNIRQHEEQHSAALRDVSPDSKPELAERQGPDGRRYVVAGQVNVNLKPIKGDPVATEAKAESVYRSAIGDMDRSPEDDDAARQALFAAQEARQAKSLTADLPQQRMVSPRNSVRMPSPNNCGPSRRVTMRNPAAIGAVIAAGARAVGGAVARGAVATARGAGRAFRAAGQAPTSRIGRFLARPGESRAQLVSRSFTSLGQVTDKLRENFSALSDRVGKYSPDVSIQRAFNRVNEVRQNFEQAQRLGPQLAELEKQRGRIAIAARDIQGAEAEVFLPLITGLARSGAEIAEFASAIAGGVASLVKWVSTSITDLTAMLYENIPFLKETHELIRDLYQWVKDWIGIQDKAKDVKGNIGDFFKIKTPPPNAAPRLNGPNFNMPLPGARPQPFPPAIGGQ